MIIRRRWIEWFGWDATPLNDARSMLGDTLDVEFAPIDDPRRGPGWQAQRSDGEFIEVVANENSAGRWLRRHDRPDHTTLVLVGNSQRWDVIYHYLARLPKLERLPPHGGQPRRTDCYGWADVPLEEAAEMLEAVLGLPFSYHEGWHEGDHYMAYAPGATINIVDNFEWDFPHIQGEEHAPREPEFLQHHRLIYIEGTNLGWFDVIDPLLASVPGLVLLYSDRWGPPGSHNAELDSLPAHWRG